MSEKNNKNNDEGIKSGPGSLLQQARISKELSIEDVSSRLRLGKDVIDALENDKYDKLPAPIFVRGYMKSYASFVGVDVSEVIDLYNQQTGEVKSDISLATAYVTPPSMTAIRDRKKKWLPAIAAGFLVLVVFVVWMFIDTDSTEQAQLAGSPTEIETSANTSSPVIESGMNMNKQQPDEVQPQPAPIKPTSAEPVPEPAVEKEPEPAATVTANQPEATAEEESAHTVKPELEQLVLVFNGDSWVDVSDATGKRLIYRMLKSGQQRSVTGQPPFKLTLGNAPEINLTRNGETVDLTPYTRGKVAKFRLGNINE